MIMNVVVQPSLSWFSSLSGFVNHTEQHTENVNNSYKYKSLMSCITLTLLMSVFNNYCCFKCCHSTRCQTELHALFVRANFVMSSAKLRSVISAMITFASPRVRGIRHSAQWTQNIWPSSLKLQVEEPSSFLLWTRFVMRVLIPTFIVTETILFYYLYMGNFVWVYL